MNVKFTAQIEAIEHTDVRGNKLLYMKITRGKNELVINIGEKSYKSLIALDDTATKLQFEKPTEQAAPESLPKPAAPESLPKPAAPESLPKPAAPESLPKPLTK